MIKTLHIATPLIGITVLLPTHAGAQAAPVLDSLPPGVTEAMVRRGKTIFEREGLCFNCHGADATGLLGPDLTDADWWDAKGSYLEIVRQIMDGVPATRSVSGVTMPARGGTSISDADVQSAAAYVWRLSHPQLPDSLPLGVTQSMVERGRAVFTGDGKCFTCHGPDARGNIGPNLTDDDWLHAKGSYLAIVTHVLSGVTSDRSRSGVAMPARGGANLTNEDVHAVAAYVWAISRRP